MGVITITPNSGIALDTKFTILCTEFADED